MSRKDQTILESTIFRHLRIYNYADAGFQDHYDDHGSDVSANCHQ
jgi:hypothetical protein